jgi:hypothetical protein
VTAEDRALKRSSPVSFEYCLFTRCDEVASGLGIPRVHVQCESFLLATLGKVKGTDFGSCLAKSTGMRQNHFCGHRCPGLG